MTLVCWPKLENWDIIHKPTVNSHHGHTKLRKICLTGSPLLRVIQTLANISQCELCCR